MEFVVRTQQSDYSKLYIAFIAVLEIWFISFCNYHSPTMNVILWSTDIEYSSDMSKTITVMSYEHSGIPNDWRLNGLLNCLFRSRSKKTQSSASLAFVREFTGHRWIPLTKASNTENVSIWCHYACLTSDFEFMKDLQTSLLLWPAEIMNSVHDDVIKRKHFVHYWPFVRIHQSPFWVHCGIC